MRFGLLLLVAFAVVVMVVPSADAAVTFPAISFADAETNASTVLGAVVPVLLAVMGAGIGLKLLRSGAKKIGF